MQFSSYAKTLAAALSLAVVAGCSSGGGTQDGDQQNAGMNSGSSTQGMSSSSGATGQNAGQQAQMPSENRVYFDFDSDSIRPQYESMLNQHAQYLQRNSSTNIVLEGHTDPRGTREYNLGLGERRANAVRQYLTIQGVPASQIEVVSYGEERRAASGNGEQAYSQDRRVVIDY
ncbi:peptidoglycan-associated lipoprotein Pal [Kushneria indalinina]|uniref:Peptidoglycan-associated protein n=1 Tax=Kushneria indalinina DSM 14324 TaxID=1122140 RepID=A0A3D9DZK6_9GAMM|nr:peptidoglycan-associated lipoprotein Pal [Kushneria indalinina]REC96240.1 peptidoglycan-associated lipoprotein [Kushneria indalinina DSM 14324]